MIHLRIIPDAIRRALASLDDPPPPAPAPPPAPPIQENRPKPE